MTNRTALSLFVALSVAVIFYSIVSVADVSGVPRLIASAIGIFLVVTLLLSGFVDSGTAGKGAIAVGLTVLPRLLDWACRWPSRSVLVSVCSVVAAIAAYFVGPAGIVQVTIACDEANQISLDNQPSLACDLALNAKIWRWPWQSGSQMDIRCRASKGSRLDVWVVSVEGRMIETACGSRPLTLDYLHSGVDVEGIDLNTARGIRMRDGQMRLRKALQNLPARKRTDNLLLATWNFSKFGLSTVTEGLRSEIALYVAEILSHFDVVAVQEIQNRKEFEKVLRLLGRDYALELGAPSPGRCGKRSTGGERIGFIYDRRKVTLTGGKSSLVLPEVDVEEIDPKLRQAASEHSSQPCRPPYLARFDVQGRGLLIATIHAFYGGNQGSGLARRLFELTYVFRHFKALANSREYRGLPFLVAGNFQASKVGGPEQSVIEAEGFTFFGDELQTPTSVRRSDSNDRIAAYFQGSPIMAPARHGIFKHFEHVFREEELDEYRADYFHRYQKPLEQNRYKLWREFKLSDHNLKWIEFRFVE